MLSIAPTEARKLHDRLKHPIIDADGHWAEYLPLMREELWGEVSPDSFKGTVVEKQAADVLARGAA